jgi:hypothetical protein
VAAFGAELRRRKVWRTTAACTSVALVIALAVAKLYDVLLPDWTPRLVIALLLAGLPVALAFIVLSFDNLSPDPAATLVRRLAPSDIGTPHRAAVRRRSAAPP